MSFKLLLQTKNKFKIMEENDEKLFWSAFASLKSLFDGHSHFIDIF